ncbi:5'-nucleotidase SurE [Striga asiatica]|uniref:5'-nucleotidase SurE n=1 Tax=Striga asiatica TaxID=4170 RepID=A0A5A7PCY8_STRAF|nr:5'-nucleotidase SurE [Striga asiatica]
MRDQAVGEVVADVRGGGGELGRQGEGPPAESGDADGLAEGGVGAAEGEGRQPERRRGWDGERVGVEGGDEAAVAVGVVEAGAGAAAAAAGLDGVEGAAGGGAELIRHESVDNNLELCGRECVECSI